MRYRKNFNSISVYLTGYFNINQLYRWCIVLYYRCCLGVSCLQNLDNNNNDNNDNNNNNNNNNKDNDDDDDNNDNNTIPQICVLLAVRRTDIKEISFSRLYPFNVLHVRYLINR